MFSGRNPGKGEEGEMREKPFPYIRFDQGRSHKFVLGGIIFFFFWGGVIKLFNSRSGVIFIP